LSFDDNYVNEWVTLLPLLEGYDAKVTFFICRLGEFTEDEKESLQKLIDKGHEIGAHGEMHVSVNEYVKTHGLFSYLQNEVQRNIDQIEQFGVTSNFFALPYGEHNKLVNLLLWFKFDGIRDVVPGKSYKNALLNLSTNQIFSKFWFSSMELNNSNFNTIPWQDIQHAASVDNTAFLVHLHRVGDGEAYELSRERLSLFLQWGKENGFKFLPYSDIF